MFKTFIFQALCLTLPSLSIRKHKWERKKPATTPSLRWTTQCWIFREEHTPREIKCSLELIKDRGSTTSFTTHYHCLVAINSLGFDCRLCEAFSKLADSMKLSPSTPQLMNRTQHSRAELQGNRTVLSKGSDQFYEHFQYLQACPESCIATGPEVLPFVFFHCVASTLLKSLPANKGISSRTHHASWTLTPEPLHHPGHSLYQVCPVSDTLQCLFADVSYAEQLFPFWNFNKTINPKYS